MEIFTFLFVAYEFLICSRSATGQVNSKSGQHQGPGVEPLMTHTNQKVLTNKMESPIFVTLHGHNICNESIEYNDIVRETFQFIFPEKKSCHRLSISNCTDGFYTVMKTAIGVRNVTKKMMKTIQRCCHLYKERNNTCVKDIIAIAITIAVPSVLICGILLPCVICCYCCCCKNRRRSYGKV